MWLDGAEDIFDRYTFGVEGSSFTLPANSDAIIESERM